MFVAPLTVLNNCNCFHAFVTDPVGDLLGLWSATHSEGIVKLQDPPLNPGEVEAGFPTCLTCNYGTASVTIRPRSHYIVPLA